MYCPKCHQEFNDEKNEYCPKCGYHLKDYKKDILEKFDKKHRRNYNLVLWLAFLIGALTLTLFIIFPDYYLIFLIFPCVSFFIVRFLSRQIGVIDIENTPEEVIKYLKKSSILVWTTYLINIGTIIYGIVKIISAL